MRKLILATAALASLAAPLAAQTPGDLRDDRRDVRHERHELNDARAEGDRREVRDERHDLRDARDQLRDDRRERFDDRRDRFDDRRDRIDDRRDDRHEWRDGRGAEWRAERRYSAGRYYYPRGYGYRAWAVGGFLPRSYWGERYWVGRPLAYGLPNAWRGTRWVRVGPDALLIRVYDGSVVRVARGIFY